MNEINNMSFEEAYEALRDTVSRLENPKNKIEENIALYEKACLLVLHCRGKLDEAQLQITDINERIAQLKESDDTLHEE